MPTSADHDRVRDVQQEASQCYDLALSENVARAVLDLDAAMVSPMSATLRFLAQERAIADAEAFAAIGHEAGGPSCLT
jgi:hypothetical protein